MAKHILIYSKSPVVEQLLKQHCSYGFSTLYGEALLFQQLAFSQPAALIINSTEEQRLIQCLQELRYGFPIIVLGGDNSLAFPCVYPLLKPIRLQLLVRMLESLLATEEILALNSHYSLHPASRTLTTENLRIPLTEKEFALLRYLYDAEGRTISKGELLQQLWGYSGAVDSHTLETHIYRLRQKIAEGKELISTEGEGYCITPS